MQDATGAPVRGFYLLTRISAENAAEAVQIRFFRNLTQARAFLAQLAASACGASYEDCALFSSMTKEELKRFTLRSGGTEMEVRTYTGAKECRLLLKTLCALLVDGDFDPYLCRCRDFGFNAYQRALVEVICSLEECTGAVDLVNWLLLRRPEPAPETPEANPSSDFPLLSLNLP